MANIKELKEYVDAASDMVLSIENDMANNKGKISPKTLDLAQKFTYAANKLAYLTNALQIENNKLN